MAIQKRADSIYSQIKVRLLPSAQRWCTASAPRRCEPNSARRRWCLQWPLSPAQTRHGHRGSSLCGPGRHLHGEQYCSQFKQFGKLGRRENIFSEARRRTDAIGSVEVFGVVSQDLFVYRQGSVLVSLFLQRRRRRKVLDDLQTYYFQSHKHTASSSWPFLCLWWAGAASAATRYPEPAWSRCRSEWTAASEYAQTSSDPVPILVWPSEGSLSGTRHLGDPEIKKTKPKHLS